MPTPVPLPASPTRYARLTVGQGVIVGDLHYSKVATLHGLGAQLTVSTQVLT
jgi:hypothetical protein